MMTLVTFLRTPVTIPFEGKEIEMPLGELLLLQEANNSFRPLFIEKATTTLSTLTSQELSLTTNQLVNKQYIISIYNASQGRFNPGINPNLKISSPGYTLTHDVTLLACKPTGFGGKSNS